MVRPEPGLAAGEVAAGFVGHSARRWLPIVAMTALAGFAIDSLLIATYPLLPFDEPVAEFVQTVRWGPLVPLMELTNSIAGAWQIVLGAVVITLLALLDRRAGWLAAIGSVASLLDNFLKLSFERHRPSADIVHVVVPASGYSYPSGHAVFYTWLSFMVAFSLAPKIGRPLRWLVWLLATLVTVTACLGRVWAGVHWPSDVFGGFLLAVGWCAFVLWLPERWLPRPTIGWFPRRWRPAGREPR